MRLTAHHVFKDVVCGMEVYKIVLIFKDHVEIKTALSENLALSIIKHYGGKI